MAAITRVLRLIKQFCRENAFTRCNSVTVANDQLKNLVSTISAFNVGELGFNEGHISLGRFFNSILLQFQLSFHPVIVSSYWYQLYHRQKLILSVRFNIYSVGDTFVLLFLPVSRVWFNSNSN